MQILSCFTVFTALHLAAAAPQGSAEARCSGPSTTLNFDDVPILGGVRCSRELPRLYHGLRITGGPGLVAYVSNTTQTQSCHQSSSGAGPWGKAVSKPNIVGSTEGQLDIVSPSTRTFKVEKLWLATVSRDPVKITVTGRDARGVVAKTAEWNFDRGEGPWPLELSGFAGLKKFRAAIKRIWRDENGTRQETPASTYADNIKFGWC